jgi:hypothetical protein
LSRIKADESLLDQALLIFEAQVDFIQRYLSDATMDLEFRHLWKVYKDLTGHKTPLIIIDSMGIDSRRKSLFAKRQKRVVRIVERGVTRVSEPNLSLCEAFLIKLWENFPPIKVSGRLPVFSGFRDV